MAQRENTYISFVDLEEGSTFKFRDYETSLQIKGANDTSGPFPNGPFTKTDSNAKVFRA